MCMSRPVAAVAVATPCCQQVQDPIHSGFNNKMPLPVPDCKENNVHKHTQAFISGACVLWH